MHARRPPLGLAAGGLVRDGRIAHRMGLFGRDGGARGRGWRRTFCLRQGPAWRIRRYLIKLALTNSRRTIMGRLRDKVILITGGAGAVGSAVAEAVVREGGLAVDTDLAGLEGIDHVLDVTSEADWQRVIGAVESSAGRLDGLVNAAGIALLGSIEHTDYAMFRRTMATNVDGTFLGC